MITLTNADFETGPHGANQMIPGWDEFDPPAGHDDPNYIEFWGGSINSATLNLKGEGAGWVGQDIVASDAGAVDATTFGSYTVELDYGYRADHAASGNNFGHGDITARIALWNTTTDTELAGVDLTILDPGVQTTFQWQQTGHQITLNYDHSTQTAGDGLQFRITHASPDLDTASWQVTAMFDNVSIESGALAHLLATPADDLTSSGDVGGPFSPSSIIYTLTNTSGSNSLSWNAGGSASWVSTVPDSGVLSQGASVDVTVSLNSTAQLLAAGLYEDTVVFTNQTADTTLARSVHLNVTEVIAGGASKVALLYIHAHPDDEGIFGGGVLSYYTQVRGLPVAAVCMVTRNTNGSDPLTTGSASRIDELRRAMDVHAGRPLGSGTLNGADYRTGNISHFTAGLIDTGCCGVPPDDSWSDSGDGYGWGTSYGVSQVSPGLGNLDGLNDARQAAAWAIARQIRRFRPEVIVTCHDLEGDYGHSNHTSTAIAIIDAWSLASDAGTDIDGLAPWQAKKLYLRGGSEDNRDTISYTFSDPTFPSSFSSDGGINPMFHHFFEETSISGQSPRQVADSALVQHVSQGSHDVSTVFRVDERIDGHHSEWWTLYRSEVGPDDIEAGFTVSGDTTGTTYSGWAQGDFFDNLTVFPDFDEDGLDDRWEDFHFGNGDGIATSAERALQDGTGGGYPISDGDGRDNLNEFVTGTDPNLNDAIDIMIVGATNSVEFSVPAAAGPGYEFLSRRYQLLFSADLADWSTVVAEGLADGTPLSYPIPDEPSRGFYRLALIIE